MLIKNKIYLLILLVLAGSCKLTQTYQRPKDISKTKLYRDIQTADSTSIGDLTWKQFFTDSLLQSLIQEGIKNNNDLAVAQARIKKAAANFKQSRQQFLPNVSANGSATLQQLSVAQGGSFLPSQAYQLSVNSSWEADLWGKLSSNKRANLALLMQSEAYKRAVQTQLVSDIASNYFLLLALDAQLKITEKTLANRAEDVETVKILKGSDVVTGAAVMQSEANRYAVQVTVPDLKQSIRETENAISILLGRAADTVYRQTLNEQTITTDLRTGLPAQLLANRPDVQEAEYQLRYYFELVNVAKAYFYPSLTLTAQGGLSNSSVSQFFSASSLFGNIVAGLAQPIFNQGLNKQRLKQAQAGQDESLAAFRQTLLVAGQEVSNALFNYQSALEKEHIRANQIHYLEKSVEFTKELLKYSSSTSYIDVLTSEQSLLGAQLSGIIDKQQELQAMVSLYRSLGGGWK